METEPGEKKHLFTNKQLWALLVPVVVEQILNSLMGTADTMMVSNVGSAAISAVSLVDSINVLVIQVFAALAAGGTIICSQYMGQKNTKNATDAAKQLIFIITAIAVVLTVVCVVFQIPLLHLIFGKVEAEVMINSEIYFLYTALSFPFIAVFNAGSSVFRAQENTRLPMTISVISNIMNIVGNAILIFGFHMGVAGAALSTLISRIFCAIVVMYFLRSPKEEICVRDYTKIRPDRHKIKMILALGIPTGIENGMFQFGKLAIQSTVSTLGTAAIAAGNYDIMAAVMIGGMTPPCAIALATLLFKDKFTKEEREAGPTNFIMGLAFITEGAIPFAASDPLRVLPSCIIGSAVAGGISMAFKCTLMAPHGGIFVFPVVGHAWMYLVALVIGTVISALLLGILKKKVV